MLMIRRVFDLREEKRRKKKKKEEKAMGIKCTCSAPQEPNIILKPVTRLDLKAAWHAAVNFSVASHLHFARTCDSEPQCRHARVKRMSRLQEYCHLGSLRKLRAALSRKNSPYRGIDSTLEILQ